MSAKAKGELKGPSVEPVSQDVQINPAVWIGFATALLPLCTYNAPDGSRKIDIDAAANLADRMVKHLATRLQRGPQKEGN